MKVRDAMTAAPIAVDPLSPMEAVARVGDLAAGTEPESALGRISSAPPTQ